MRYTGRIEQIALTATAVVSICIVAFAGGSKGEDQSLLLKVATSVDKPMPTLAFIAKNTGTRPLETTPICTNYNRLVVRLPNGEVHEEFAWKKGIAPVLIVPGETTVWYVNLSERISRP